MPDQDQTAGTTPAAQGDGSPDPARSTTLSQEQLNAVNAVFTARAREMGLHELKGGVEAIQQTLANFNPSSAGQAGDSDGGPAPKPGTMSALERELAELREQNAKLSGLVENTTEANQELQKRQVIAAALVAKGVPADSQQLRDAVNNLMPREDIRPTGRTTVDGQPIWQGTAETPHGPNPQAALADVVGSFVAERPYLLPPTGGNGTGAADGVQIPGMPGGGSAPSLSDLTPEQLAGLKPEELDRLWVQGGGQQHGAQPGLYPAAPATK